ncbi:MAG: sugar transferase [Planctomycetota bacterium]
MSSANRHRKTSPREPAVLGPSGAAADLTPVSFTPQARRGRVRAHPIVVALAMCACLLAVTSTSADASLMILLPIAVAGRPAAESRRGRPRVPDRETKQILVVGRNQRTRKHFETLETGASSPTRVVGVLDSYAHGHSRDDCADLLLKHDVQDFGDVSRLAEVLRRTPVDEVLVTLPIKSCYDQIQATFRTCEEAGITVSLCGNLFGTHLAVDQPSRSAPRLTYSPVPQSNLEQRLKRVFDIVGASVALILLAIPMLVIAIAVKLTSRGPVFFLQQRSGLNHRAFRMIKFRTMVKDAEARKSEIEHLNEQEGPVFKIARDPRITPVGRFLRKFSLDELPQFFNVLRGEMSLVGPRPPIPKEVEKYEWWQRRRLSMKPGLTCLWQVSGRNKISFRQWMELDLEYIDNWSLWLDVKLILKTIPAVLFGRGAS